MDVEKNFVVEVLLDIEWWDEGFIDGSSYDVIDDLSKLKISIVDIIIMEFV